MHTKVIADSAVGSEAGAFQSSRCLNPNSNDLRSRVHRPLQSGDHTKVIVGFTTTQHIRLGDEHVKRDLFVDGDAAVHWRNGPVHRVHGGFPCAASTSSLPGAAA